MTLSNAVNKSDLVERLSQRTDLSKRKAKRTLNEILDIITESLTSGEDGRKVTIHGFGTFDTSHRKARKGVDPQDHDKEITIPARTVPKFRPGSRLKETVREAFDSSS